MPTSWSGTVVTPSNRLPDTDLAAGYANTYLSLSHAWSSSVTPPSRFSDTDSASAWHNGYLSVTHYFGIAASTTHVYLRHEEGIPPGTASTSGFGGGGISVFPVSAT